MDWKIEYTILKWSIDHNRRDSIHGKRDAFK
jgi:hypothetical protein